MTSRYRDAMIAALVSYGGGDYDQWEAAGIADAVLADFYVTPRIPPVGAVWLTSNNTITSVVTLEAGGPQVTRVLAEPFKIPEDGWYRLNPDMRMERA